MGIKNRQDAILMRDSHKKMKAAPQRNSLFSFLHTSPNFNCGLQHIYRAFLHNTYEGRSICNMDTYLSLPAS